MLFKIEFPIECMFKKRKTRNAKKPNINWSVYVYMFIMWDFDFSHIFSQHQCVYWPSKLTEIKTYNASKYFRNFKSIKVYPRACDPASTLRKLECTVLYQRSLWFYPSLRQGFQYSWMNIFPPLQQISIWFFFLPNENLRSVIRFAFHFFSSYLSLQRFAQNSQLCEYCDQCFVLTK